MHRRTCSSSGWLRKLSKSRSSVFSRPPCSWNFSMGIIGQSPSLCPPADLRQSTGLRCPVEMSDLSFTHLDPLGRARMVDVTPKEPTHRRAVARCKVFMQPATTAAIANREVNTGDVLGVARVAGIQAAKRTSDTIPLCHPLLVGSVYVNFEIGDDHIAVEAQVDTVDRPGVEIAAMHACSIAALTIYD